MAPTESPQKRHLPLLYFIIALLLVKSKPQSLSGPESCKQLVSLMKEGPRSKHSTGTDAHIDITAFWRNRSSKLEEQNAALEARVSRLQAEVSELEAREVAWKRTSVHTEDSTRTQRLKRTGNTEPADGLSVRNTKRARTKAGVVTVDEQNAVPPNLIDDNSNSEWDELGNNLLDSLRVLQGSSIATTGSPLRPKDLASTLSSIADVICRHVSAIDLPVNSQNVTSTALLVPAPRLKEHVVTYPQTEPEDFIEQRLIPIGRTFPHFLTHLHTLSQFSESGNLCGQTVYRFTNIFRVMFQRICDLAVANARSNQARSKTNKKRDGQNEQCATRSFDKRPITSPTIMKLCKLAISMLFHLDSVKSTHKAILEGCFHLLVTRVGEVLKDFTIGRRPVGIQEDDETSRHNPRPRGRRQLKLSSAANDAEASEAQAPYLIWILSRTQRLSSMVSHDGDWQSQKAQPDSSRDALHDYARIRFQHTLVRAIFGEGLATNFEPALEPPHTPPDDDLRTDFDTQIETADVKDWFKKEVWRLVGWDVLRGNMAWD